MIEFILARYNYWIVIILMMTGLYIVFSRGNLVKTIVGLNIFQTSVFIFYITIAKVAGGTAPILIKSKKGDGYGSDYDAASKTAYDAGHGADPAHSTDPAALSPEEAAEYVSGTVANDLSSVSGEAGPIGDHLHTVDGVETPSNDLFATPVENNAPVASATTEASPAIEIATSAAADAHHAVDAAHAGAHASGHGAKALPTPDPVTGAIDGVIYSNPLPHVLILTAIVVGVATTAVGLALAIRIREAFGTIEEDALEQMNNEAEFGELSIGAGK